MPTLEAVVNRYGGAVIRPDSLPSDPLEFAVGLEVCLGRWVREGIPVVWLELPVARVELVVPAVVQGFQFHHATSGRLLLVRQLVPDATLPTAPTHTMGVGGLVLNDAHELLVVLERRDERERPGYYKLPGGMLEPGEHLAEGAMREVLEETGILTECLGLLAFRHHHRGQLGASNIYAIVSLRPLSVEIACDSHEIAAARWMPVDEFLACDQVGVLIRRTVRVALAAPPLPSIKLEGYMDDAAAYEIYLPEESEAAHRQTRPCGTAEDGEPRGAPARRASELGGPSRPA